MKNADLAKRDLLPNEVNVDLYMLGPSMLDRVRGHINSTDIVAKDNCGSGEGMMKLAKELTNPTALGNGMSNCPVLCFCTGARNCSLTLRGPGDKIVAEIDAIA
jgi:hypothetical protein